MLIYHEVKAFVRYCIGFLLIRGVNNWNVVLTIFCFCILATNFRKEFDVSMMRNNIRLGR